MYYIVYKTINKVNQKFYIGKHKQADPYIFDGYLGSGILLENAIIKYGRENFIRSTLFVFDNEVDAYQKEAELITLDMISSQDCYNLCLGGYGGDKVSYKTEIERLEITLKSIETRNKNGSWIVKAETKLKMAESAILRIQKYPHTLPNNKGRIHVGQGLKNIQDSIALYCKDSIWVTNGIEQKKINDLDDLPEGWWIGRNEKCKIRAKNRTQNKESIEKIVEASEGNRPYNNGIVTIRLKDDEKIPHGFKPGFAKRSRTEEYSWYTNGITNIGIHKGDIIPEGFTKGRLVKPRKRVVATRLVDGVEEHYSSADEAVQKLGGIASRNSIYSHIHRKDSCLYDRIWRYSD